MSESAAHDRRTVSVPDGLAGERVDAAMARMFGFSRSRAAELVSSGLVQLDGELFVQELFHGPTLAFKDMAMQLLGRLFDHVLERDDARVTIVGATSGDTGSAAIEACRDRDRLGDAMREHEGIVDALRRRAGDELSLLMFEHMRRKCDAVCEHLADQQPADTANENTLSAEADDF